MHVLRPQNLIWLLLLVVPVLLYLFRRQSETVRVSTLHFFKTLAKAHSESPWLRWLKRLLSFLLTAAVLAGLVGALSRPVVSPEDNELKSIVLLVDRSASMGATAKQSDQNRLENGLETVRNRLSGVPEGVNVMVITYDRRPEILRSFTLERRRVRRALNQIRVRPAEGDHERALKLARRMASFNTPSSVWHVTDSNWSPTGSDNSSSDTHGRSNPDVNIDRIRVRTGTLVNGGITAFRLRRKPMNPGQLEMFIELHCSSPDPVESELQIKLDGKLIELRTLSLDAENRKRLIIPLEAGAGKVLEAEVRVPGDRLEADNDVQAFLPKFDPIDVLWIHPEKRPFTRMALLTMETKNKIQLSEGKPNSWSPERIRQEDGPDVVLFDSWVPESWPSEAAVALVNPPGSAGPINAAPIEEGSVPVTNIRPLQQLHPLTFGVAEARLTLEQTSVIHAKGFLEPIWAGPSGPLLAAGLKSNQRIVVMAFSPESSGRFPLMASYPILMGNVIFWCADMHNVEGDRPTGKSSIHQTGAVVRLKGANLTWLQPESKTKGKEATSLTLKERESQALSRRWIELSRTGLWKTDEGERGSSLLLSKTETMLNSNNGTDRQPDPSTGKNDGHPAKGKWISFLSGDLSSLLLWIALVFLLSESWLRNKWAVY